jgi:GMP synthase (glutamine-hydrolysing)
VAHLLDFNAGEANRGVAALAGLLDRAGFRTEAWEVRVAHRLPPVDDALWVLSGGPGSPLAEGEWRAPLLEALAARVGRDLPTLGVCYGFELLALAAGASVRTLGTPRTGTFPLRLAGADAWLAGLDGQVAWESRRWAVFGGSGDVLAHGSEGDVAAARYAPRVCGVIFHPEADLGPDTRAVYEAVVPRYLAALR